MDRQEITAEGQPGQQQGLALFAVCGVLLRFPPDRYGFYPVCPFHALTGMSCPGCGGTRAIAALLHGRPAAAWRLNSLVVAVLPMALSYAGIVASRAWRGLAGLWPEVPIALWWLLGAATIVFGVVRNL